MNNEIHARNTAEAIRCARKLTDHLERAWALDALADALRGDDPTPSLSRLRAAEERWIDRGLGGDNEGQGDRLEQAAVLAGVLAVAEHVYLAQLAGVCEVCS